MVSIIQRLRDAFRPRQPQRDRQIFVDDDSALEVLPASAADWCAAEFDATAAFSAQNRRPGGAGWSNVYVRPAAPAEVSDLGIPFAAAVQAVGQVLPRFEAVLFGSTDNPRQAWGAVGFGPSPLAGIVLTPDRASPAQVTFLELILRGGAAETRAVLAGLAAVPAREPLMLVDWNWAAMVRPEAADDVERYIGKFAP